MTHPCFYTSASKRIPAQHSSHNNKAVTMRETRHGFEKEILLGYNTKALIHLSFNRQ